MAAGTQEEAGGTQAVDSQAAGGTRGSTQVARRRLGDGGRGPPAPAADAAVHTRWGTGRAPDNTRSAPGSTDYSTRRNRRTRPAKSTDPSCRLYDSYSPLQVISDNKRA